MTAKLIKAALLGGLIGGAIDIAYAMIVSNLSTGMAPDMLLRVVAGGVLGREQIAAGGLPEAALGGVLHFAICIVMAAVFCLVSLAVPALRRYWYVTGPVYGVGLYVVMNYVVLPLSALAVKSHPEGLRMVGELASHMLGVGLSISAAARWVIGRG
ncbi:hypothetical protein sos41_10830 [Alphaproteobacteria bacterium SO-S41]|nr:hypothetical protein sos41_10830 [Alphaproteobacteria bacterium SO-S41]